MSKKLVVTFGCMCPSLVIQLQGFGLSKSKLKWLEKLHQSVNQLAVSGMITDKEKQSIHNLIMKCIVKLVNEAVQKRNSDILDSNPVTDAE